MAKKFIFKYSRYFLISAFFSAIFFSSSVFAASTSGTFGEMADNMNGTLGSVAALLQGIALIAGIGFAIAAIFKFKQHKDNPTQIPIGTPIALVFIGASLIFLPSLISTTGQSLFSSPVQSSLDDSGSSSPDFTN